MIEILKETARYLVCVKPIGIAAQGTQAEAMPQLLSEQLGCDIFPVHRLDQTGGGVMVFAKTAQEAARLTQAMGQIRTDNVLQLHDEDTERQRIITALQQTNGNKAKAARLLGVDRKTIYNKIEKLGI